MITIYPIYWHNLMAIFQQWLCHRVQSCRCTSCHFQKSSFLFRRLWRTGTHPFPPPCKSQCWHPMLKRILAHTVSQQLPRIARRNLDLLRRRPLCQAGTRKLYQCLLRVSKTGKHVRLSCGCGRCRQLAVICVLVRGRLQSNSAVRLKCANWSQCGLQNHLRFRSQCCL